VTNGASCLFGLPFIQFEAARVGSINTVEKEEDNRQTQKSIR